jgi:hypothetical protein
MPNLAINGAVGTTVNFVAWQQTSSEASVSGLGNANPSGTKYIFPYQIRMAVSGKDASRTIALGIWNSGSTLLARTDNFTVAASTSAPQTSYRNLQSGVLVNTSTSSILRFGFWVSGKEAVYHQRDTTSQSGKTIYYDSVTRSSIGSFTESGTLWTNSSLVGNINYYTLPAAPTAINATPGQGQISLNWKPSTDDGGTAITSYTLQRATNSSFTSDLVTTTGITTGNTTVTGLTNGTPYYFRVAAVNSVATAASTTGAYITLAESVTPLATGTVPGPPTELTFTPSTSKTSIDLSWTAPESDGGSAITEYSIRYTPYGPVINTIELTGSTETSYTISGLPTNTSFIVDVAAVNANGTGPYSENIDAYTAFLSSDIGLIKRYDSALGGWRVLV